MNPFRNAFRRDRIIAVALVVALGCLLMLGAIAQDPA